MWAQNRNFKGVKLLLIKNVNAILLIVKIILIAIYLVISTKKGLLLDTLKMGALQRESAILTLKFLYDLGRKRLELNWSLNTYFKGQFSLSSAKSTPR